MNARAPDEPCGTTATVRLCPGHTAVGLAQHPTLVPDGGQGHV